MWNCFSSLHSSLGEQLLFSLFPTVTEMLRASKMVYKNNPADFFQACRMELCRTFCMSLKSLSPFCSWGDALTVPTVIFWLPHRFWMCWERTRGDLWFLPNNTQEVLPVHRFWGLIYFLLFRGFCLRLCFALGIRSVAQRCHLILGTLSRVQKGGDGDAVVGDSCSKGSTGILGAGRWGGWRRWGSSDCAWGSLIQSLEVWGWILRYWLFKALRCDLRSSETWIRMPRK